MMNEISSTVSNQFRLSVLYNISLSTKPLMLFEIIEVQTGTYLGEDNIVRIADQYGC